MKHFLAWLMSLTVIMRYFVIAVIVHVGLIALLGSIKIVAIVPKIVASFAGAPLPPPMDDTMPDDPFAAYRDFDYSGPEMGAGGGLGGEGAGGSPDAGGQQYAALIAAPAESEGVADVFGVYSDSATAIARPALGPTGLGGAPVSGMGDALASTTGIKGPGGGMIGGRMGPARATNLKRFGGSIKTEQAVLAALRWLKANQKSDGSWPGPNNPAVSALAVLAFLGHGENADSEEFGLTVQNGIQYLVSQVRPDGSVTPPPKKKGAHSGGMYHQAIMGIALAEAMALTQSPVLRDPLEKVVDVMLRAQQAPKTDPLHQGGWRYKINDDNADLSVSGWVIMALKSARNAGVEIPQEVFDDAAEYVWNMFSGQGFGYNKPGTSAGVTPIGLLSLNFLGHGEDKRLNKALDTVKDTKFLWNYGDEKPPVKWQLYSWYYAALGIFQSSQLLGRRSVWIDWNKDFQQALVYNQADDGHWEVPPHSTNEQGKGPVYATVMCTLMLEVYYRYLPIYQIDQSSAASPRQTAHLTTTP